MLIEFTVENFRSFRDPATLSMVASSDKELGDHLSISDDLGDLRLLRSAVVYGPNAAGKSNLMIAFALLRNLVLQSHGHQKGIKLNHQPFAFDERALGMPSVFEIMFLADGVRYRYRLAFDAEKIVEESLHYYPKGRKAMLFSRKRQVFDFNKDVVEQEVISRRTSENVLYLSSSVQFNYKSTLPAFNWFRESLFIIEMSGNDALTDDAIEKMNKNRKFKGRVIEALKIADMGVVDLKGKNRRVPLDEARKKLPPQIIGMMTMSGADFIERNVNLIHEVKDLNGNLSRLPMRLENESEGTRKLLAIIGPIINKLEEGGVIVIDELETKLHHSITEWLLSLFHDPTQNKKGAQLIFNTHDQLLLNLDTFRRDQIWFVERDPLDHSSSLFSLAEFRVRKDKDVMKAYGSGRYGAVPFVSEAKVIR